MGPPNLLYAVNDISNQNSAYLKKSPVNTENSHDIEKTMSQQCVQIEFVEEIVLLVPAGLVHHCFYIRSPKTEEEEGETGKLNKKRTQNYAPHKHL